MDITSAYNSYLAAAQTKDNAASSKIEKTISSDLSAASDEELMSVCKEFEAYFIEQIFKGMKNTVAKSEESSGSTATLVDYFEDGLYQQYAKDASSQGEYGLAQMLYEQMKRNYDL